MEISGIKMRIPLQEEKAESWKKKCYQWTEEAERVHLAGLEKVGTLMAFEIIGGNCPKCSIPWKRIEFNNNFTHGVYYVPACRCYYYCQRCHNSLHLDEASGKLADNYYFCTNCGFPLNGLAEEEWMRRAKNEFSKKWLQKYIARYRGSPGAAG